MLREKSIAEDKALMHSNVQKLEGEKKPSQETEKTQLVKQKEKDKSSIPGSQAKKAFQDVMSSG